GVFCIFYNLPFSSPRNRKSQKFLLERQAKTKPERREKRSAKMDPKLTEVSQLFERFKAALSRKDFDSCTMFLSQLKVMLTEFRSLPPLFEETPNAVHELTLARDIYEHAVVLSVKTEDQDAFERDFFQLKPYYTDARNRLPPSSQEHPILGLNLLRLLVQNRIAEFHTELELLSSSALENPCIKHAVELEQSFMEGAYNRVLSARQTVPHETYVYFMDLLAKTVRLVTRKPQPYMEMLSSSSPLPLHHDELYMQQKMIFSDSLKELKNMRKQLYSAAEYFEVSYRKGDQKQIVVETLKDYTIKALINSVDHLGSMGDKINKFMDEKNIDVSSVDLKLCSIEQKVRTCQGYTDRGGIFQQSLTLGCSKHHKRYIIPVEATTNAINQSNNMISHSAEDDSVKEQRSISAQTPRSSSPKTFQLKRTASIPDMKELSSYHFPVKRSGSVVKRSMTINSSTSKQQYPKESWRSSSMSTRQERDRAKSPELHSGLNKRLLKALVSIRKYRKDATLQKHSNEK
ncbi:hypothetical protein F8388_014707, partial [Cannabis sativa]